MHSSSASVATASTDAVTSGRAAELAVAPTDACTAPRECCCCCLQLTADLSVLAAGQASRDHGQRREMANCQQSVLAQCCALCTSPAQQHRPAKVPAALQLCSLPSSTAGSAKARSSRALLRHHLACLPQQRCVELPLPCRHVRVIRHQPLLALCYLPLQDSPAAKAGNRIHSAPWYLCRTADASKGSLLILSYTVYDIRSI